MTRRRLAGSYSVPGYRRRSTEDGMTETVEELVDLLGGRMFHVNDSRTAPETVDMPDLLIIVPNLIAVVELKSQKRATTVGQMVVRELMASIPENPYLVAWHVRPEPNRELGERSFEELLDRLNATREHWSLV